MTEEEKALFRPLSAKVLPRSAQYTISGREIEPSKQLQIARRRGIDVKKYAPAKPKEPKA